MRRKTVSGIMLSLLLVGMLILTFNIQPVKSDWSWTETIYIRADGSFEPDTAPISSADNITYTLTDNIVGDVPEQSSAIVVERDNIVLDGAFQRVQGICADFSKGIVLSGRSNITIKNMEIKAFEHSIYLNSSSHNTISGNIITNNYWAGIRLEWSCNNKISGNNLTNNQFGTLLSESSNNTLTGNNITNNEWGIYLDHSFNNTINRNNITNNTEFGIEFYESSNNNISGNIITENGWGGIRVETSNYNSVSGNNLTSNWCGIGLYWSSNNSVSKNNITNNRFGIELYWSFNNSVSENKLAANNESGISLSWSSNNSVSKNNITKNNEGGIRLGMHSSNNTVSGNNVTNNIDGIWLEGASSNIISGNTITNNEWGIRLYQSSNNTLRNNFVNNKKYNFDVYGSELAHYIHDMDDSNTLDGKPVYYWVNRRDLAVPLDAGYVALVNCTNITVQNLNLNNNGQGVLLASTTNSTITKNNLTDNCGGISLYWSSDNTMGGNNITANEYYGIGLDWSSNNTVYGNAITNNGYGIALSDSEYNTIYGNNITNNENGIWFGVLKSSYNVVLGNSITNNKGDGIHLLGSSNNTISGNNITNNGCGIRIEASWNNIIYHNNFVDNIQQVNSYDSTNVWDDGYPSGGNYWSDYTGVDIKSGPNQDQPSSDGIGDTAYVIDGNNRDNYPLMYPWGSPSPPSYTLTIYSSPTGVTFTVDSVSRTTPWSETYSVGSSVSLVMPEIHTVGDARYYWNQWNDGNTSRSRTVTMNTDVTLTAYYTGPCYQLTVTSSPITGITFTIDGTPQTTPYTEWLLEDSYTLVMPETHNGYVWSHWLEDGDPNRIKTILLQGTTWTAVYEPAPKPVGGKATPINMPKNKPETPILWIWLTTIIILIILTVVYVTKRKKHTKINYQKDNQSAPTA